METAITWRYEPRAKDGDRIRELVLSTGMFNDAEVEIAVELVQERLAKGPASGYLFVFAEVSGSVAGYACYGPIDGTSCSYDLFWIAVHRDSQRLGLGRRLLEETEHLIRQRGGGRIYAETSGRAQYEPTRCFYDRSGYVREATLTDFYGPGDDKVFYVKVV